MNGMDSETIEATAAQWFAKQKSDHWTGADQAQLDAWLNAATAHRVAFVRLNAAWQHSARLKALGAGVAPGVIPPRHSWTFSPLFNQKSQTVAISSGTTPEPRSTGLLIECSNEGSRAEVTQAAEPLVPDAGVWPKYRALAASFLLAATLGLSWYLSTGTADAYRTKIGSTDTIPLRDGSEITLNSDSRIRVALNETERRIQLDQGEAFFAVAKDSKRPFIVMAGEKRVVAVGTKFSVRREANDVRVIVTEGRVRLEESGDDKAPSTQLIAGAVAQTKDTAMTVQQHPLPEAEQLLSWRVGYVTFRDTDLAEAVAEFNRYSERKITIQDPEIAHIRIGGNFRTDNAEAFLWLLQTGFPVNVEQRDDRIILTTR